MHPLVSVIVPAFQAQATINRCLQSLAATSLAPGDLEILIESDDATSYCGLAVGDFTVKRAHSAAVQTGPGPTRNRALRRVRGEWITYIDADDHVGPGYLDNLLTAAQRSGAALAQTRIVEGNKTVLHLGRAAKSLRFDQWARTGMSVRGMFHRSRFPEFTDAPAQDILHIVECTLLQGRYLEFSDAVYLLTLGKNTVTAQPDFKERVSAAYGKHIDYLNRRYVGKAMLPEAVAFWQAKAALNQHYKDCGAGLSFYEFVARGSQAD